MDLISGEAAQRGSAGLIRSLPRYALTHGGAGKPGRRGPPNRLPPGGPTLIRTREAHGERRPRRTGWLPCSFRRPETGAPRHPSTASSRAVSASRAGPLFLRRRRDHAAAPRSYRGPGLARPGHQHGSKRIAPVAARVDPLDGGNAPSARRRFSSEVAGARWVWLRVWAARSSTAISWPRWPGPCCSGSTGCRRCLLGTGALAPNLTRRWWFLRAGPTGVSGAGPATPCSKGESGANDPVASPPPWPRAALAAGKASGAVRPRGGVLRLRACRWLVGARVVGLPCGTGPAGPRWGCGGRLAEREPCRAAAGARAFRAGDLTAVAAGSPQRSGFPCRVFVDRPLSSPTRTPPRTRRRSAGSSAPLACLSPRGDRRVRRSSAQPSDPSLASSTSHAWAIGLALAAIPRVRVPSAWLVALGGLLPGRRPGASVVFSCSGVLLKRGGRSRNSLLGTFRSFVPHFGTHRGVRGPRPCSTTCTSWSVLFSRRPSQAACALGVRRSRAAVAADRKPKPGSPAGALGGAAGPAAPAKPGMIPSTDLRRRHHGEQLS